MNVQESYSPALEQGTLPAPRVVVVVVPLSHCELATPTSAAARRGPAHRGAVVVGGVGGGDVGLAHPVDDVLFNQS